MWSSLPRCTTSQIALPWRLGSSQMPRTIIGHGRNHCRALVAVAHRTSQNGGHPTIAGSTRAAPASTR